MALLNRPANLLLQILRELVVAIQSRPVSFALLTNRFDHISNDLGGDTAPVKSISEALLPFVVNIYETYQCRQK